MIAEIELGILAALKAAADDGLLSHGWKSLETYPEDWDQWLKEQAVLRAPAAWVTFRGWRLDPNVGEGSWDPRFKATFGLVVMAENSRSEQERRHGDVASAAKPGSYTLAINAARVLHGSSLGLAIDAIEIGSLRFVIKPKAFELKKVSMMALELTTGFALSELGADELDPFTTAHVNWDIPTLGEVGPSLPDDADADATDHIALEQ